MSSYSSGPVQRPDHRFVHRADDYRTRQQAPPVPNEVNNADQVVNAIALTLNRAGTDPGNPILAGLGLELSIPLGLGDELKGIYLFQRLSRQGANLRAQATLQAPGVYGFKFLVGSGQTIAGDALTGAVKNYLRIQTGRGSYERQFFAKLPDHDVVTLNEEAALDEQTLEPAEVVAEIVDASRDWLEVRTDFFVSWNDPFLNLHRASDPDPERGFAKAYGGAAFVSFFDAAPGTEGTGVQVKPLNQVPIHSRRTIQVENTVGLKSLVARFRSKQGSPYFVDVPILIQVVDQDEVCLAPQTMPCVDLFIKAGSATPAGLPSTASVPMVQVVPGPAGTVNQDLLYITIRGATVGGAPKLRIRRWAVTPSPAALVGARKVQLADVDYLPLIQSAGTPETDPPYGAPKRYTVALSVGQLKNDNVHSIDAVLVDGSKPGMPVSVFGPKARDLGFIPIGPGGLGAGGGVACAPY